MKKFTLLLLSALLCSVSYSQKVELTLTDGTVVTGTTNVAFLFEKNHSIFVTNDLNGEQTEYESSDVKSGRYYAEKEKEWYTFFPLNAQSKIANVWNKNPKPFKKPVFMILMYEGEKVSVYKHFITTVNTVFNANIISQVQGEGYVLYYLIKGEEVAKAYAMSPGIVGKAYLKLLFKKYPGMKGIIKSYDMDEFYKDPVDIIKKLESVL